MLDKFLRNLIHQRFQIGKLEFTFLDALLAVCISAAAGAVHLVFFVDSSTGQFIPGENLLSCAGNFALALAIAAVVRVMSHNHMHALVAYAMSAVWPVFVFNSAYTGGTEVFHALTLAVALCVILSLKKYSKGMFLGFLAAASLLQILQADIVAETLTTRWPNIYLLYSETGFVGEYGIDGKLFTAGALLIMFYYLSKKEFSVTPKLLISGGLFFSLFISYFLPFMNYRSGFTANMLAILLMFADKKKFYQPMLLCLVSYVSFSYYYTEYQEIAFWPYALVLLFLMFDTGMYFYQQLQNQKETNA
ncbi:MAG: hypothetical protein ACI4DV_01690 [Lachnospiraceae bacterium]